MSVGGQHVRAAAHFLQPAQFALQLRPSMNKVRLVGLDVSPSAVGIALSDPQFLLATPLTILKRHQLKESAIYGKLRDALEAEGPIGGVVVGWPLSPKGGLDQSCFGVQSFAEELYKVVDWPITLWDERGTSGLAKDYLGDKWKRKRPLDNFAAMMILQSFLNENFDAMDR